MDFDLILSNFDWDSATRMVPAQDQLQQLQQLPSLEAVPLEEVPPQPQQQVAPPPQQQVPPPQQQVPPPRPEVSHNQTSSEVVKKTRKRRADGRQKKEVNVLQNLLLKNRKQEAPPVIEIADDSQAEWLSDYPPERRQIMQQAYELRRQLEVELQEQETRVALLQQDLEVAKKRADECRKQVQNFLRLQ